jgi:glycosyltransferase involved in cell wall biosynthesis
VVRTSRFGQRRRARAVAGADVPGVVRDAPFGGQRVTREAPHSAARVLFVVASLEAGGAERVIVQLASATARTVATTLVVIDGRGPLRALVPPAVELVDLELPRVRHAVRPLIRLIRRLRPAAVVTSQTHVNIMLAALAPLLPRGTRTVVREAELRRRSVRSDRAVRLAHRTLYRTLDLVLATSPWMAADLALRHRGRIALLPNPVDVATLRAEAAGSIRPPSTVRPGRTFVHLGRLIPEKGAGEVLEAFAAGAAENDRLVVVGDGPERAGLAARAEALGITARVTLVGFDPRPIRHLATADALVLASRSEGMPNVVLESLAVGTPVVAVDELVTLGALAAALPAGALRLVPRRELADALREAPSLPAEATLRASLLPEEHLPERVAARFLPLVLGDA